MHTAATRAKQQVVLMDDMKAAKTAVRAPHHSDRSHVTLGALLHEQFERMN